MGTAMTTEAVWQDLPPLTRYFIEQEYRRREAQYKAQVARREESQERMVRLDAETFKLIEEMGW